MQPKPLPKPFTITNGANEMKNLKYFSAAWCGPCKTFKPIIEEISSEGHSVQFIDIDTSSDLAERYNVRSVPTVVVEENGIEIDRFIGTQSNQTILEAIG